MTAAPHDFESALADMVGVQEYNGIMCIPLNYSSIETIRHALAACAAVQKMQPLEGQSAGSKSDHYKAGYNDALAAIKAAPAFKEGA